MKYVFIFLVAVTLASILTIMGGVGGFAGGLLITLLLVANGYGK